MGRSMSRPGTTTRVATARVPGLSVGSGVGWGVGLAEGERLGEPLGDVLGESLGDGDTDGEGLAIATSVASGGSVSMTGVSLGTGPAVVGSA